MLAILAYIRNKIKRYMIKHTYGGCGITSLVPVKNVWVDGGKYMDIGEYVSIGPGGYFMQIKMVKL